MGTVSKRDERLRREFHITEVEYDAVLAHQGYCCAGCKRPATDFKNGLAVDHDHKTGQVRGLLCWLCNKALGKFNDAEDSIPKLRALADYLEHPPFTVVLGQDRYTAPGRLGTKVRRKALAKMKESNEEPTARARPIAGKPRKSHKCRANPKRRPGPRSHRNK